MPASAPVFFLAAMSPYSWLAAERIEALLPDARWQGVYAGAIFKANGRVSWGLTERREAAMADCEARASARGLGSLRWPDPWPTNDIHVARGMVFAQTLGLLKPFALGAMRMAFLEGADLGQRETVLRAGARVGMDRLELERAIEDPAIKQGLRATVEEALAMGVFGVPSVVVDGKLFWGDDRLEDAQLACSPHP